MDSSQDALFLAPFCQHFHFSYSGMNLALWSRKISGLSNLQGFKGRFSAENWRPIFGCEAFHRWHGLVISLPDVSEQTHKAPRVCDYATVGSVEMRGEQCSLLKPVPACGSVPSPPFAESEGTVSALVERTFLGVPP